MALRVLITALDAATVTIDCHGHRQKGQTVDWRERGACREVDPELFFPVGTNPGQVARAVSVCRRCDVAAECLEWAMAHDVQFGVWGGLGEQEREHLARRRRRALPQSA